MHFCVTIKIILNIKINFFDTLIIILFYKYNRLQENLHVKFVIMTYNIDLVYQYSFSARHLNKYNICLI